MSEFTHFDADGASRMVDVGDKPVTARMARASGGIRMAVATWERIRSSPMAKGDVLEVARLAGIMAAKKTADLIPLCHTLPLDGVEVSFEFPAEGEISISATVRCTARTGVEMEALVAVSTAALTIYDMVKAIDKGLVIGDIQLEEKSGGRSGHYVRAS